MRFKRAPLKELWPEDKTRERIAKIKEDIAQLSKQANQLQRDIVRATNEKEIVRRKTQRKWKYLRQLQNQLGGKNSIINQQENEK